MNTFLSNVDHALARIGKKRPWLADTSGVGLSTVNNWFAYDRTPNCEQGLAVAKALGTTIEALMGEKLTPPELSGERKEIWAWLEGLEEEDAMRVCAMIKMALLLKLEQVKTLTQGLPIAPIVPYHGPAQKD